jgi:hypothetical protein
MSTYRTAKLNEAFYSILTVFDLDGTTPVSGQTISDFTVRFSLNDAPVAGVVYTITEVGTTGDYVINVPAGFPSKGLWAVTATIAYNGSTWRDEVEVRAHDIDDVYDVIVAGGSGVEQVTLTVVDTANANIPVPDALVNVYDATGAVLVTFQRTDTSGEASVLLDAGDYVIRVYKPGISCDDDTITVADTGGLTPQAFTIECASVIVAPPASPMVCRLYADFITQDGLPFEQFKLKVENLYDPESSSGLAVIEAVRTYETDSNGHVEFDIVRGARVRVAFITTPLTREFVVPDKPVESLLTVFGAATDAFQVVKRT